MRPSKTLFFAARPHLGWRTRVTLAAITALGLLAGWPGSLGSAPAASASAPATTDGTEQSCRAPEPQLRSYAGNGLVSVSASSGKPNAKAPNPPPPDTWDVSDGFGNVVGRRVQVQRLRDLYVPYTNDCNEASDAGLRKWAKGTKMAELKGDYQFVGRINTFAAEDANWAFSGKYRGAVDLEQTDLNWDCDNVASAITYIRRSIDAGLPVKVGVNEAGNGDTVTTVDGKETDGVTDHILLISGYEETLDLDADAGEAFDLMFLGVDNAAGSNARLEPLRWPILYITDPQAPCDIRKDKTPEDDPSFEQGHEGRAVYHEYQLTYVKVYAKDKKFARKLAGWAPW